ncbi:MAG: HD domain-containing protein [Candidatus Woesearchaeota archaeon]
MSDVVLKKYICALDAKIQKQFSKDSCHDLYHLYRVYTLALAIQRKEGGDRLVIGVAAFLHDLHRVMQIETGAYCEPAASLPKIKTLLESVQFPKEKISAVLHAVEFHEEYTFSKNGKTVYDIETLIVQDADNLDAIGAIGIGRTFGFSNQLQVPMWNPSIPLGKKYYDEHMPKDPSTLHHFYSKLLRLKDTMNTKTAKKMALGRHHYMQEFVREFMDEWNGRK